MTNAEMGSNSGPVAGNDFSPPLSGFLVLYENGLLTPERLDQLIEYQQKMELTEARRASRGMAYAFILALSFLGAGLACVLTGHDAAGATIATADVVALAWAFLKRQ